MATILNAPEGFLVQARNGTDPSSEIIGTFLDPSVVSARNPNIPVNYQCKNIIALEADDSKVKESLHA